MTTVVINKENQCSYIDKITAAIDNLNALQLEEDNRTICMYKAQFPYVEKQGFIDRLLGKCPEVIQAEEAPRNIYKVFGTHYVTDNDWDDVNWYMSREQRKVYPTSRYWDTIGQLQKLLFIISKQNFVQADVSIELMHKIENKGL